MTFEEMLDTYALCDGAVVGLELLPGTGESTDGVHLTLRVRRPVKGKMIPVLVGLSFGGNLEVHINDDGDLVGGYSDITRSSDGGRYYVSVDPFGSSGVPDERDNWVIVADNVDVNEYDPPNNPLQPDGPSGRR